MEIEFTNQAEEVLGRNKLCKNPNDFPKEYPLYFQLKMGDDSFDDNVIFQTLVIDDESGQEIPSQRIYFNKTQVKLLHSALGAFLGTN